MAGLHLLQRYATLKRRKKREIPVAAKKTILVVDDQEDSSSLVREFLQLEDEYRIFTVASGSDAYAKIKNVAVDLIITDYMMPRMSGAELYNIVRTSKLNTHIPVLVISGYIEKAMTELKKEPFLEFLAKPFTGDSIIQKVKQLLEKSETLQEKGHLAPTKPQVDVNIMNHFIGATLSTLTNMVDIKEAKNGPIQAASKNESSETAAEVSGMINMNCQSFTGSLILSFPVATILAIHNKILDEQKSQVDEDVAATVGEMVNIIWGRTKKLLEAENLAFTSSLPMVFQNTKKFLSQDSRTTTLFVPFSSELGPLRILFTLNI